MARITLNEAAARLGIAEAVLCKWIEQGYLDVYLSPVDTLSVQSRRRGSGALLLFHSLPEPTKPTEPTLYLDAEQVEELADRRAWSRLGYKSWMRDEEG